MRLLLDTHAFLWWVADSPKLSARARRAIGDAGNECLVSAASCWEMAINLSIGKLEIPGTVERFVPHHMMLSGFRDLPVEMRIPGVSRKELKVLVFSSSVDHRVESP